VVDRDDAAPPMPVIYQASWAPKTKPPPEEIAGRQFVRAADRRAWMKAHRLNGVLK
jgi:hypothetical protein